MVPATCGTRRTTSGSASRVTRRRSGSPTTRRSSSATSSSSSSPTRARSLDQFATFGVVESVKAVSDLYAPVGGRGRRTNDALTGSPELVNGDPYGGGWMIRRPARRPGQLDELLDAAAYDELIAAG